MKKWLIVVTSLSLLLLLSAYIFIPQTLTVAKVNTIKCSINGLSRFLLDENNWGEWWPGNGADKAGFVLNRTSVITFKGFSFKVTRHLTNELEVLISTNTLQVNSRIELLPESKELVKAIWKCAITTSSNPFKKLVHYKQAMAIQQAMADIFQNLELYVEKTSNVYGMNIIQVISKDSTLIGTRRIVSSYPGAQEVYRLIDTLKQFIAHKQAQQTNYPMLHVKKIDSLSYEIMVAIPVNKALEGNGNIFNNRFVPWKTLVAETRGGHYSIDRAYGQMQTYIEDYQRTSMAIPFESLVTDRRMEKDTLKWITRICQPVF